MTDALYSFAKDKIAVAFQIFWNFVDQDRISVQIRYLNHGHDPVFGMVQKKIRLAGIVQGDQLDYPLVDVVVRDAGRNGKTAGS